VKSFVNINNKVKSFKQIITVDSDKSISIRSLIFASLSNGISKIKNLLESEDIFNTIASLKKLGVKIKKKKKIYFIYGVGINRFKYKEKLVIDAGNSGTLARLIFSILIKSPYKIKLIGDKSLSKRDFGRIITPLSKFGAKFYPKNKTTLPLMIKKFGNVKINKFSENKGSAQVKSAIMLAALHFENSTQIFARKSRNHTENFFKFLNIPIKIKKSKKFDNIKIKGVDKLKPFKYNVPSDISSSLFFIALTILTEKSELTIKNVNINFSRLGAIEILKKMGVKFIFKNKKIYNGEKISDIFVKTPKKIKSINCPSKINSRAIDEFLIIFLIAAKAKGTSFFKDLGELNQKESPRLKVGSNFLTMIGIKNYCTADSIKIIGNPNLQLNGNYIMKNFLKDHRVFMMSIIAALTLGGNWKIFDPESAKTSFPSFLKLIEKIGGNFQISKKL
tara:strand:+ start:2998 stop:4341 length:1344 start_codon:yes stop_codon:yes gene_type:complete